VVPLPPVTIVNATPFFQKDGQFLVSPGEWKSLMQWFGFLDRATLLKPEFHAPEPPEGWLPLPEHARVVRLCEVSEPIWKRRRSTTRVARRTLKAGQILYARMPNYEGYWCDRVARALGIPLLIELHGDWEAVALHRVGRGLLRRGTRALRAGVGRRAIRAMCERAFGIITIGPELAKKYAPESTPTLINTNHLLEEAEYTKRTDHDLGDPPIFLFVGALEKSKGVFDLFEALARLHREGRRFAMRLAGTGSRQGELQAFARAHGFAEEVAFLGMLPHGSPLFEQYRQADLFLLPSLTEGVPRVTHEAMAMGCPVLATDVGSIPWQLRDGAGLLVPSNDPAALAEAMARILDEKDLRERLSSRGYQRALEHTLEKQQQDIELYFRQRINHLFSETS